MAHKGGTDGYVCSPLLTEDRNRIAAKTESYDPNDLELWNAIKDTKDPENFKAYLKIFPRGKYVKLARARIKAYGSLGLSSTQQNRKHPLDGRWVGSGTIRSIPPASKLEKIYKQTDVVNCYLGPIRMELDVSDGRFSGSVDEIYNIFGSITSDGRFRDDSALHRDQSMYRIGGTLQNGTIRNFVGLCGGEFQLRKLKG